MNHAKLLRWPSIKDAIDDDRAFDVRLVQSTIAWHQQPDNVTDLGASQRSLAWVGRVLEARAQSAGLTPLVRAGRQEAWIPPNETSQAQAAVAFAFFVGFAFELDPKEGLVRRVRDKAQIDWFDVVLEGTPLYGRLRIREGRDVRMTVPWLNTVDRVTAYVVALLIGNRWELTDSLRVCPFVGRGSPKPHLFLDYRVDEAGRFLSGEPQQYCSPRHRNAYRQRRWQRDKRAAGRHK